MGCDAYRVRPGGPLVDRQSYEEYLIAIVPEPYDYRGPRVREVHDAHPDTRIDVAV